MLNRYRGLKGALPFFKPFITPYPCYSFSFIRLTEDMEVRKKQRFDIGEVNHKVSQRAKPIHERIKDMLNNNKRKLAFFIGLCALLNFFEGYKGFVKLTRVMEPVKLQLKIWFLGEKHYIPDSIEETFMTGEGIKLKEATINTLSDLFVETDRELKFGITKKLLRKLFTKLNVLKSKEERQEFYSDSIYSKEHNQKLNGVSLKQFLLLFQTMLRRARKEDSSLTEEEFLRRLRESWDEIKFGAKRWEEEFSRRRLESNRQSRLPQERSKLIKDILIGNPTISLEDFEKQIVERGFQALSLREKIDILESQLTQLSMLKSGAASQSHHSFFDATQNLERFKEFEQRIQDIANKLAILRTDFQRTLDKSLKNYDFSV